MTNKKLKMAAMSVALTACVAASPLAANADAPEATSGEPKTEPVAEETKKEENTAEPQVNQEAQNAQETLKDAEVKYDKEHPTTNPDGSQKLDGVIVTNPNPGSGETDTKEKKPEEVVIGTAEKTEKSETTVETNPKPGAKPIEDTTTPPTVEKNPDGSSTITQTTVTPGTETTTTTGTGTAKGDLDTVVTETPKEKIDLDKELGENPDISWDIKQGDKAVEGKDYTVQEVKNDGNKQTLVLRKEDTKTAEMTAEDIAKLVDAEKPTVNPDGTYTLTRTETILDAEGNPQTRTTYITIRDNKVTTKTTTELTITREKEKQEGNERVDFEVKYPEITVTNQEKPEEKQTISPDLLDTILSQNPKEDGSYEYTDGDGRKYEVRVDGTAEKLNNAEIVERLNRDNHTEYTLGADGEIYYKTEHGETVKLDVTQNELLRQSLTYKVTLTTTEKGSVENESKKPEEESKARMNAIRDALNNAVGEMGVEDPVKAKLTSAIANATLDPNGGTFKEEIDGKIYILTYTGAEVKVETKEATNPDVPGKNPEEIDDVMDNTVTGTAYVTNGKVSWTDTRTGEYHEITSDPGAALPTPPKDAKVERDDKGRPLSFDVVTTDENGYKVTTTYKITYSTLNDIEKADLAWKDLLKAHPDKTKEQLIAEGYNIVSVEGDVTKAEWTVTKKTEGTVVTPAETINKTLVAEGSVDLNYQFSPDKSTLTVDGEVYTKGEDGKYTRTETDGKTTYTVTLKDEELTDKAIKDMLAEEFKIDASKITLKDGKTATYTDADGKSTVTIDYSKLKKTTLTIDKSVVESVQKTVNTTDTDALDKAYDELWADIQKKRDDAFRKGEELWVGKIKVTETTQKEEIITYLKTAVTQADMTTEQIIAALNAQKELAKKTKVTVNEGTRFEETLDNYYSGDRDREHAYTPWWDFSGDTKGDYIRHLDLASGAKLDLLPGEDGTSQTTDCVLVNPKLEWNDSAENLLADQSTLNWKHRNKNVGLDNKISYDEATGEQEGHFEYERGDFNNHPKASAFYKVTGTVAYGKVGNAYKATPTGWDGGYTNKDYAAARRSAEQALAQYKAEYPDAQVVEICEDQNEYGGRYYQIYLYQSDLTAYGYMTRDANVCTNATAYKQYDRTDYFGGYDLMISKLVEVRKGQVVGENQSTIKTIFAPISIRSSSTKTNSSMMVNTKKTSTPFVKWTPAVSGTQTNGEYKYDVDRKEEQIMEQSGTGEGHYKSFTNLIRNIFNGEGTGTVEGGFIKYEYHTEKDKEGNPVQFEADKMVVTTKQDAEVHYTFTSQESRDVWIKGYTQTVVPPVNPGPDTPELPPVEDAKPAPAPAPAPETPVLPVVQDARPDPAPTPAPTPAPAPETPVLPAVQDAKLIQTGTSGWLADLMLGAGMVLSAAGYWMERKRKAMFYKSQH